MSDAELPQNPKRGDRCLVMAATGNISQTNGVNLMDFKGQQELMLDLMMAAI